MFQRQLMKTRSFYKEMQTPLFNLKGDDNKKINCMTVPLWNTLLMLKKQKFDFIRYVTFIRHIKWSYFVFILQIDVRPVFQ